LVSATTVAATLATAATTATAALSIATLIGATACALALARLGLGGRVGRWTGVAYLWGWSGVTDARSRAGGLLKIGFVAHDGCSLRSAASARHWRRTRRDDPAALRR